MSTTRLLSTAGAVPKVGAYQALLPLAMLLAAMALALDLRRRRTMIRATAQAPRIRSAGGLR